MVFVGGLFVVLLLGRVWGVGYIIGNCGVER